MKIFIWLGLDAVSRQLLEAAIPDSELHIADRQGDQAFEKTVFLASDVTFGNVPAAWLAESSSSQWLQLESVGFGEYQSTIQPTQTISNLSGFGSDAVAETALAGLLGLYRRIDGLVIAKQDQVWKIVEIRAQSTLLGGKQVIILGGGAIGMRIRALLEAFGCKVSNFARRDSVEISTLDELDGQLPQADIVIGCLPDTPQTAGLINSERLARFKPGAVVVNVGRGSLIDEVPMIEALHSGQLGGAVLDVTAQEPLSPEHPLWTCPNTILTQHTAGGYNGEAIDKVRFFLANLERYRAGETVLNIVSFERGY